MQRPLSIILFGTLFAFALAIALLLTLYAGPATEFGFALPPAAREVLLQRIAAIRLVGIGVALSLLVLVVCGRSRGARAALGVRWLLGVGTSIAFLRGIGMVLPGAGNDVAAVTLSVVQIGAEGLAILLLYGDDAAPWFACDR